MNGHRLNSSMANLARSLVRRSAAVLISMIARRLLIRQRRELLTIIATLVVMEIPTLRVKTKDEAPFWQEVTDGIISARQRRLFSIIC